MEIDRNRFGKRGASPSVEEPAAKAAKAAPHEEQLDDEHRALNEQLAGMKEILVGMEDKLAGKEYELAGVKKELSENGRKLEQMACKAKELKRENAALEKKLGVARARVEDFQTENGNLRRQVIEVDGSLEVDEDSKICWICDEAIDECTCRL